MGAADGLVLKIIVMGHELTLCGLTAPYGIRYFLAVTDSGNVLLPILCQAIAWTYADFTPERLEMHGCVPSFVATDALVLKHKAINVHSADKVFTLLFSFIPNITFMVSNIRKYN